MPEPTAAGADPPGRTASSVRLPRLVLEVPSTGRGMFDGAWWPRSDDATGELPDLVAAISAHAGCVVRVGIHRPHWRRIPHTVLISGNLPVRVSPVSTTAHAGRACGGDREDEQADGRVAGAPGGNGNERGRAAHGAPEPWPGTAGTVAGFPSGRSTLT